MTIKQTTKTICHAQYNQDVLLTKMYHRTYAWLVNTNVGQHVNRMTGLHSSTSSSKVWSVSRFNFTFVFDITLFCMPFNGFFNRWVHVKCVIWHLECTTWFESKHLNVFFFSFLFSLLTVLILFSRQTPLSRQLRTQVRRKWFSSAWPTKAGWIPSSAPSSSCSRSAPKPEWAEGKGHENKAIFRKKRKKVKENTK